MKKLLLPFAALILLSSCAIFKKKDKYGCPNDATGKTQEEIRDTKRKKFKAPRKF